MGKNKNRIRRSCLIKWLGYNEEHNSWEPQANLEADCLHGYWDTQWCQSAVPGEARTG